MILPTFLPPIGYLFAGLIAIIICATAILFYRVLKNERDFEKKREDAFKNYEAILNNARERATDILTKATDKSINIYRDANLTNEKILEEFDRILHQSLSKHITEISNVSNTFLDDYKKSLSDLRQTYDQKSEQSMDSMEKAINDTFGQLTSNLQKEFVNIPDAIKRKIQETFELVDKDIEIYKQERYKQIADHLPQVIMTTYEEILGKNIPMTIQNELIISALERAKKEEVLSEWK